MLSGRENDLLRNQTGIDAIQIDIEPAEIGRNYPLKAAVQGDAKTVLFAMAEIMDTETATNRTAWTARMQQIAAEWQTEYEPLLTSNAVPIRPERICRDLTDALPSDAFVVVDTGSYCVICCNLNFYLWMV